MKTRNIILAALLLLACASCRKEAGYVANPYMNELSSYMDFSYEHQFESVWQGVNSGYAFWDIDTVDWDCRYKTCSARLAFLMKDGNDSISDEDLQAFYEGLVGNLIDHHMYVEVKNISTGNAISVSPGDIEVRKRSYYHEALNVVSIAEVLEALETQNVGTTSDRLIGMSDASTYVISCVINLPDGRIIPYLWQSGYNISETLKYLADDSYDPNNDEEANIHAAAVAIDNFFKTICNTPREQIAGIILDNRSNGGGNMSDFNYIVGSFVSSPAAILENRSKNGIGRRDFAPWAQALAYPNGKYHRDIVAENIPYVILQDINSLSMGELTGLSARHVLSAHIIGERSYGGQGTLSTEMTPIYNTGTFGDRSAATGHYVYMATYANRTPGGEVLEGKGSSPDEEVLFNDKGAFGQLKAAIDYIKNK